VIGLGSLLGPKGHKQNRKVTRKLHISIFESLSSEYLWSNLRTRLFGPLVLVATVLLAVLAWWALRPSEPSYHGKRLSVWLRECRYAGDEDATNAVPMIGTNALPTLLQLAGAKDSGIDRALQKSAVQTQRQSQFMFEGAAESHELAICGYAALGPVAAEAVPALTNLLSDSELQVSAIACLGNMGFWAQDAIPALIAEINNPNVIVGACAKAALANIHRQPELVVPALLANLAARGPTPHLTIQALGRFGKDATGAIPAILPFLADGRVLVRMAATNAIKQIDSEAAGGAGLK